MSETHRCPICTASTEIGFTLDGAPAAYMVLEGEFVGLSDITSRLYCENCDWELTGVMRNLVLDLNSYKITAGEFVPNE